MPFLEIGHAKVNFQLLFSIYSCNITILSCTKYFFKLDYVYYQVHHRIPELILTEHVAYQTTLSIEDVFVIMAQVRRNAKLCAQRILGAEVMSSIKFVNSVTLLPLHLVIRNAEVQLITTILDRLIQMPYVVLMACGMAGA